MYKQKLQYLAREASFPIAAYGESHFVITPAIVAELRMRSYFDQWLYALTNGFFHLRLADHSLFLFSEGLVPSYSFLHCPLDLMTFSEFLSSQGLEDSPANRRKYEIEYDSLFETASRRPNVTPIRFDFHPAGYNPGVHPAGHIHIGLDNEIRISSNKMNAVSFVLFVMRQMYPNSWRRLIERLDSARISALIRHPESPISPNLWGVLDEVELHLR